jgi:hypothetical protein
VVETRSRHVPQAFVAAHGLTSVRQEMEKHRPPALRGSSSRLASSGPPDQRTSTTAALSPPPERPFFRKYRHNASSTARAQEGEFSMQLCALAPARSLYSCYWTGADAFLHVPMMRTVQLTLHSTSRSASSCSSTAAAKSWASCAATTYVYICLFRGKSRFADLSRYT